MFVTIGYQTKNDVLILGSDQTDHKVIIKWIDLWSIIHNHVGYKKIIDYLKQALYNWFLHYPQVVQYW